MNAPIFLDDDDIEMPLAPEGWCVNSEDRAAWATEQLLAADAAIERLERQFERNHTRLTRERERRKAFFVPQLEAWAQATPPKRGKTIHLATGDIGYRTVKGGVFVEDEAACLEWAEANLPESIRRGVIRKLDHERAKRAALRLMSEAVVGALQSPVAPDAATPEAIADAMAHVVAVGEAALPPGIIRRDDRETFFVKGGK